MIIGYSKIGRSLSMDPNKYGYQGDAEAPNLLRRLALRNPQQTFAVIGKHTKKPDVASFPSNILWPWLTMNEEEIVAWGIANLDGNIVHLGQHGTSHQRIPMVSDTWAMAESGEKEMTTPLQSLQTYGAYMTRILNGVGDKTDGKAPVSYIVTDPRNYLKARDIKWPTGMNRILGQHAFTRLQSHDRFKDTRNDLSFGFDTIEGFARDKEIWIVRHTYRHGGLELMILDDSWESWGSNSYEQRSSVGVASTSAYDEKPARRRSALIRKFIWEVRPEAEVFGKWDLKCMPDADGYELLSNPVADFPDILQRWRVTMAMPAITRSIEGQGWTTAKPYQAFAARTVCLFAPDLDQQGWIIPSRTPTPGSTTVADGLYSVRSDWTQDELSLARWLRVTTPEDVSKVVTALDASPEAWLWIVETQRSLLKRRWDEHFTERVIEYQMGI